ncbi:hypothetical protein Vadar_014195 [Vaccinium darrowii]|uniref:Uncharacterized protein n=1 Tax=Vaccinium darrowii TaxID=229202 RepID=A0ACB7YMV3_9ERIC|nr:hypothetical protein Vadar_014195 [Vaccinium darrowii]
MEKAVESGQLTGETCGETSENHKRFGSWVTPIPFELPPDEMFGYIPTYNSAPRGPNPPVVSTLNSRPDLVEFAATIKSQFGNMANLPRGLVVEDFIGNTLFGQVYRGKINQQRGSDNVQEANVMVKAWNCHWIELQFHPKPTEPSWRRSARGRFQIEMKLLTTPSPLSPHHNMVKLIGSGLVNGRLAVVYELDPLDTLRNLLPRDDFDWFSRVKVAIQFASLVSDFHSQQLRLRNICADNLVLEKDFHLKFVDFGMLIGGDFGDMPPREKVLGCFGYEDPYFINTGEFLDKSDVFSYGVLLLELVTKRAAFVFEENWFLHVWAREEYEKMRKKAHHRWRKKDCRQLYKKSKSPSVVHESFRGSTLFDANDGAKITKLALRCVCRDPDKRPTIKEAIKYLRQLEVAKMMML